MIKLSEEGMLKDEIDQKLGVLHQLAKLWMQRKIFCDNLYEKRIWKRMNICICITESLCCTSETNNIVNQLYSNNFFLKFLKEI